MNKFVPYFLFCIFVFVACGQSGKGSEVSKQSEIKVNIPNFNPDSAYAYTAAQVNFGPRVPNTAAHVACGNYLSAKLKEFGAQVFEQEMNLKTYDNIALKAKNIIGFFQPENKQRILLFAHWDTRPFSDQDADPANHKKPIDGANDGAGACGVLLELARQFSLSQPNVGIDIIFFDAEDWGVPAFDEANQHLGGYCLGSDFWGRNPHIPNYSARYGILLDMVSATGAKFYKEGNSRQAASHVVSKVWDAAAACGFGNYFINADGGTIEDDHVHVMRHRGIPCIDIIEFSPDSDHGFGHYWHTQKDNMDSVSKETMQAVGQTLLYTLYHEK